MGYDSYNQANRIERNGIVTEYYYGTGIDAYKKIETEGSKTTTTLYIGNYEEITTSSSTKERTTHGGYLVITRENETIEQSILLQDRLGSITTIVDANLQPGDSDFVRQFRSYDPFGQSRDFQGQDNLDSFNTTDQGFTGHRHLNDQKLIHMRGRVYDYQLGRFLSPDPIILDPQDSQSLNAYSYVMNNPLAATDPTGYVENKGDTGQKHNGRSKSEDDPTTESGQKASKVVIGKAKISKTGSRIKRTETVAAVVDGNGNVTSFTVLSDSGQGATFTAGEGSRSGGASDEGQADQSSVENIASANLSRFNGGKDVGGGGNGVTETGSVKVGDSEFSYTTVGPEGFAEEIAKSLSTIAGTDAGAEILKGIVASGGGKLHLNIGEEYSLPKESGPGKILLFILTLAMLNQ